MGQLATVIATEDSEFRTAVTQLVRSSGVPVSIVVERASENGGGAPAIALVDVRSPAEFSGELLAPEHLPQEGSQG